MPLRSCRQTSRIAYANAGAASRVTWAVCLLVVTTTLAQADPAATTKERPQAKPVEHLMLAPEPPKPAVSYQPYTLSTTWQHVQTIPLELAGIVAWGTYLGIRDWDWGSSRRFNVISEGWFGKDTNSGGMDKLGHAYQAYIISDFVAWRLRENGFDAYQSAVSGALISWSFMAFIEVFDGFSVRYGASPEDMVFNTAGVLFSFLRNTVPGLREKLDFRVQYIPSGYYGGGFRPVADYSGKKQLLALKLAGFETFKRTPLRFVELHAGYFARGFSMEEQALGIPKTRHAYVGIGLNLSEVLFSEPAIRDTLPGQVGRTFLEYVQVPYTYVATDNRR
jgi:hypothetical protein